jgi:hypothetical protein
VHQRGATVQSKLQKEFEKKRFLDFLTFRLFSVKSLSLNEATESKLISVGR